MQTGEYRNIFNHEERHFFYVSIHDLVIKLVQGLNPFKGSTLTKKIKILDAGCGTGFLAKKLEAFGKVSAVDLSKEAVFLGKKRGIAVLQASIEKLPFKANSFDLVVCIDVIYHQQTDDLQALREMYRVLKPGGKLILRVPARRELFSAHDRLVLTKRRFTLPQLREKLVSAGFVVERISYLMVLLYLPSLFKAIRERLTSTKAESAVGEVGVTINWLLTILLKIENRIFIKGINWPIGVGLLAIASKSADKITPGEKGR